MTDKTKQSIEALAQDVERLDCKQNLNRNLLALAKNPRAAIEAFGEEWAGWCAASAIDALAAQAAAVPDECRALFDAVRQFRNERKLEKLIGLRATPGFGALVDAWDDVNDLLSAASPAPAPDTYIDARDGELSVPYTPEPTRNASTVRNPGSAPSDQVEMPPLTPERITDLWEDCSDPSTEDMVIAEFANTVARERDAQWQAEVEKLTRERDQRQEDATEPLWTIIGPDGWRLTAEKPIDLILATNKHQREIDPAEADRQDKNLLTHINEEMAEHARDRAELVNRFLRWPLPRTVLTDAGTGTTVPSQRPENWSASGTNLLTGDEALAMLEFVLDCDEGDRELAHRRTTPLPPAGSQQVTLPLTDEQIDELPKPDFTFSSQQVFRIFARSVERAHGIGDLATNGEVT